VGANQVTTKATAEFPLQQRSEGLKLKTVLALLRQALLLMPINFFMLWSTLPTATEATPTNNGNSLSLTKLQCIPANEDYDEWKRHFNTVTSRTRSQWPCLYQRNICPVISIVPVLLQFTNV